MSKHAAAEHEPHLDDVSPVPYLRNGQMISLVRWDRVAGDWRYTTIVAEYSGRDDQTWRVVMHGRPITLGRAEWSIFS